MAPRKSKKKPIDLTEPIVGEVVDLRSDFEKTLDVPEPQDHLPLRLTEDELAKLQFTQFQYRAFEAEKALEMLKRDLYIKQIDPEGKLQQMMAYIRGRTDEAVAAKQEYSKVVGGIETRLKINLKEWAYDDANGILTKVDQ